MSTKQNPSYPSSLSRKVVAIPKQQVRSPEDEDQTTSAGTSDKTAASIEIQPEPPPTQKRSPSQEAQKPPSKEIRAKVPPPTMLPETPTYPESIQIIKDLPSVDSGERRTTKAKPPAESVLLNEPTAIKQSPLSGQHMGLGLAAKSSANVSANVSASESATEAPPDPSRPMPSTGRSRRKRGIPSDLPADTKAALASFTLSKVDPARYDLGEEFARGGLGRIRRATDRHLDRPVAIKELILERGISGHRFLREALITARLEHPSIVPVHDAGTWSTGGAFYTMKLVSGRSLDDVIDENPALEPRLALLPHVIDVCDAIAYAHSKKIIHRDIKPANVLIGSFGETVVIDWGLAKDLSDPTPDDPISDAPMQMSQSAKAVAAGLTIDGAVIGTPAYMSPEQVNAQKADERSDVYALGALLYHVLSGSPPYEGNNSYEILANVALRPPKPLLSLYPNIPPDLVAIVEKAMAKEVQNRYPSAKELAQDLKRFQSGQLVGARSYSNLDLAKRFVRKYKLPLSVAAAALVLLGIFGVISIVNIIESRDQANTARISAESEKQRSDTRSNELALLQAKNAKETDPTKAFAWLKLMSPNAPGWDEARIIAADAHGVGVARQVLRSQKGVILTAATSPDETKLATASSDGSIRVWNPTTVKGFTLEGHSAEVLSVSFSPDGKYLASASKDDSVRIWDISCAEPKEKVGCGPLPQILKGRETPNTNAWFSSVVFAPNSANVAASNTDGTVRIWSLPDAKERVLKGHSSDVNRVAFSPDSKKLASAGNDSTVILWDVASGTPRTLKGHSGAVYTLAFSPDGKKLASAGDDKSIRLWDLESGYNSALTDHEDTVNSIAFSPDGSMLVSASDDRMVRLWSTSTKKGQLLSGHKDAVLSASFSPDAKQILSASRDGTVRLWDVNSLNGRGLFGHTGAVHYASFSRDGSLIFSAGEDGSLRIWDTKKGFSSVQSGHTDYVNHVVFSPDGQFIASASVDHTVRLWNFKTHQSKVLIVHEDEVTQTAFSPDGTLVASASKDNTVRIFKLLTGKTVILPGDERAVNQITFSADGKLIAAANDGKNIHYWEVDSLKAHALKGHREHVRFIAFSPDGKYIASASEDKTIRIWDLSTDETIAVLSGHQGFVNHVAFSPDGTLLASASSDQTVRIWDLSTKQLKTTLDGHKDNVLQVVFSPDGKLLASSGKDSLIYLWNLQTGESTQLAGHKNAVTQILFSSNGKLLASASKDATIRLWDVSSGKQTNALTAHEDWVTYITLSPDGKTLASASRDQSTIFWEMDNPVYKDENLLYCHQVYLQNIDLPKEPAKLLAWLDSITTAQIVDDQPVTK